MPLPNKNFQWRPNDLSGETLLRYQLEADRWYDAVSDAHTQQMRSVGKYSASIGFVSTVLGLILCTIYLIVLGILGLVKWLLGGTKKNSYKDIPVTRKDYSDRLLRSPVRADYEDENEYLDVLSAYITKTKEYPKSP